MFLQPIRQYPDRVTVCSNTTIRFLAWMLLSIAALLIGLALWAATVSGKHGGWFWLYPLGILLFGYLLKGAYCPCDGSKALAFRRIL